MVGEGVAVDQGADAEYPPQQVGVEHLGRRALGDDAAAVEHVEAVAEGRRQIEVMEARQGAQAEAAQQAQKLQLVARVEVVGRFVEDQQARFLDQRASQQGALLLATGEAGEGARGTPFETDLEQRLADPLAVVRAVAVEQALVRRAAHGDHVLDGEAEVLGEFLQHHLAVGAVLALSGVAMQGLFRNPLADPGLVGVSSGAALGAALAIVFGASLGGLPAFLAPYLLSLCAFGGGLGVTWLVYRLGRRDGQTSVATMLLAGIALTALSGAVIGLFTYLADDATLRTLTFWNLGSLNGASYPRLWPLLLVALLVACWLPRRADALNALLLGESEARHLGFDVERLKAELVLCTALGVGAAVAAAGMIGFIGLVVPHLIRLVAGPDHRTLLPASMMAGAILLLLADLLARLALAPAELPIGIVTALIGAPFFLYLLLRGRA